jgi:zinc transporter, ZIP family
MGVGYPAPAELKPRGDARPATPLATRWIIGLWTTVAVVSAIAAAIGYVVLGGTPPEVIAVTQAFAAGAILTMLADTMMPEAFEHGGSVTGLATCLGFVSAFLLSRLG